MKKISLLSLLLVLYNPYEMAQTKSQPSMLDLLRAASKASQKPQPQTSPQPKPIPQQPVQQQAPLLGKPISSSPVSQPSIVPQGVSPAPSPQKTTPAQSLVARPLPLTPTEQEKYKKLIEVLEASSIDEAIENAQDMVTLVNDSLKQNAQALKGVYITVNNALGSSVLNKQIQAVGTDLAQFLEYDTVASLNQHVFDEIFELKKRYFEAIKTITEFANPLIEALKTIIDANNRKADLKTLQSLIPAEIPRMPSIKDMSKQDLIREIQKMHLD